MIKVNEYILLSPDETIKAGDEWRTCLLGWDNQDGWTGKKVKSLLSCIGGGQMRRKRTKAIRKKVCVSWI